VTPAGAARVPGRRSATWSTGSPSRRWCASTVLGAIAVFGSGSMLPPISGLAMPGTTGPIDRTTVALPPVYPAVPPGFLRLPDTRTAPVTSSTPLSSFSRSATPGVPSLSPVGAPGPVTQGLTPGRLVWIPARLEPVVGRDANGRVTSILEYTPGRFEH
jgi:hypothetical protein